MWHAGVCCARGDGYDWLLGGLRHLVSRRHDVHHALRLSALQWLQHYRYATTLGACVSSATSHGRHRSSRADWHAVWWVLAARFASWNVTELFELIATSTIKFPAEEWDMISPEAKQCNEAMLQRDPKSRPSAQQLLEMPWLAQTAPALAPMTQSSSSFGSMTNLSSAQPGLAEFNEKRAAKPKRPAGAPPGGGFRPRPVRPGGAPPPARGAVGSGTRYVHQPAPQHMFVPARTPPLSAAHVCAFDCGCAGLLRQQGATP